MKQKSEKPYTAKQITSALIAFIFLLGVLCLYYGSSFAPALSRSDGEHDGSDPVLGGNIRDFDDLFEDQEHNPEVPKSIPICDIKHSELIPCLDRNLIYQLKLKPNLTLMEHYERHCPPPERRFNCLIPPPIGYKIPIRWPESRDEVWKANIPHTHLAQEKSDQNWMVVNGEKINFPGGGTHFHDGANKYIVSLARMLKFPNDKLHNELDRLLRPGGYFAYSSPEAYALDPENRRIWNAMHDLLRRMCWRVAVKKDQTVIWQKPLGNGCYLKRGPGTQPPLCSTGDDPDATWNVHMKACIIPYSAKMHKERGSGLVPWPKRLTAAPPRLEDIGVSPEQFHEDTNIWQFRVNEYWKQMKSVVRKNYFRNVMDMNSNLGGFGAALKDTDVWVMNVAPVNMSARLKVIYDRGLIGTVHDWYAFNHPYISLKAHLEDLLIEMDRILRPDGFVIIRDKPLIINYIRKFVTALRWDRWLSEVEPRSDALYLSEERVLIARKKLWSEGVSAM
ncbi:METHYLTRANSFERASE PMT9-RELATED [Salix purpurea]|uniref:Methyltransferase n=1 Tax=Salix purpurea TaxID=77065 RepID=A0A9Q0VU20_SALPP|nr:METHYLTRANSFERASE PMT9-RELATED [Salix purpurea]